MIKCKYFKDRTVSMSYNEHEDFSNIPSDSFFIGIIVDGYVILMVDRERCYISRGMFVCFEPGRTVTCVGQYHLIAYSISFAPAFINANLSYQLIQSASYSSLCKEMNYPNFFIFLNHNSIYNGIMPLTEISAEKIKHLVLKIIKQLSVQPDRLWSCRARAHLFVLMQQTQFLCEQFMKNGDCHNPLIVEVLAFIDRELGNTITIKRLCNEFHTNHNSLCRIFKAEVGRSITTYIIDRRIELAKYSLAFTELTVDEIAQVNGFSEQTYFTKVFKNKVGVSPLKYRKESREKRIASNC